MQCPDVSACKLFGPDCAWHDTRDDASMQVEALVIFRIAPVTSRAATYNAVKTSPKQRQIVSAAKKGTVKQRAGKMVKKVVGMMETGKVKAAIAKVKAKNHVKKTTRKV